MKRFSSIICLLAVALLTFGQAKYVFYFIGDGMGTNQVLGTEMYLSELKGEIGRQRLCMTQFPYSGQAATFSASNGITDSSAAGTCLASGKKTTNGVLGQDPNGKDVRTVAETLKAQGWGVGIMTSVAIDHATPGAFYAHVPSREMYYEIGTQLAHSGFDFFGGAAFHQPNPKSGSSKGKRVNLYDLCEKQGYTFAHGYADGQQKMDAEKMILVQATDGIDKDKPSYNIPYAIDRSQDDLTLEQIVRTAIPFLSGKYERFFMMVEGGMIDYASHGNDAATAFGEVIAMDEALRAAYAFYQEHPDETLIVVTADHETGGLALGNSDYTLNLQLLQHQHCSAWILSDKVSALFNGKKQPKWEEVKQVLTESLGLYAQVEVTAEEDAALQEAYKKAVSHKGNDMKTMYKDINEIGALAVKMLNDKSKIGWTTTAHSAHAVPIFAVGVGAARFSGWHDNSDIAKLILRATTTR
ncbi:MAG: alkaline phosphatase [Paludibacteraceae bacterium]